MMRWLVINLAAPMSSYGGEAIDALGVTRDFPALSAITGLLGNALGYERYHTDHLQALQTRLRFGARRDREPILSRMTDFQTAQLSQKDKGWTTRGELEGRAGGANTYHSPHIRWRDYFADMSMAVVLTLQPAEETPTLDDIAQALDRPARPLFIGRKSCLPSGYLNAGFVEAPTARAALMKVPAATTEPLRAIWPGDEEQDNADTIYAITDARNWPTDLHGGQRLVAEGRLIPEEAA